MRNEELVANLAAVQATLEASERESNAKLKRMETIIGYAILYAHVELMFEFKEGCHAKWDPDHQIEL